MVIITIKKQMTKNYVKLEEKRLIVIGCLFYYYILCRFVIKERHFVAFITMVYALHNKLRNKMKEIKLERRQ